MVIYDSQWSSKSNFIYDSQWGVKLIVKNSKTLALLGKAKTSPDLFPY